MNLRPICPADLPELLSLCCDHANHEGLSFSDTGQTGRWQDALFGPNPRVFGWVVAAAQGGPLLGYMTATVDFSTWDAQPFVYLDCLYLRPEARRNGLGRRMMATLNAFALTRGCAEVQWQTPPTNGLGLAFYRAIQARELPKLRFALTVSEEALT